MIDIDCCTFNNTDVDIEDEIENLNKQRYVLETNSMTDKSEVCYVPSEKCSEMEMD